MYFSKKNMVYFVQIPKQSYIKVFQNMFIVFCTRIYMEMNNLRVYKLGHQWLRCYIPNQKDPGSNPHQQDVNQKVFPGAFSSKLGNSKIHKKNNCLFEIKKVFSADNYFMESLTPSRNPCFCCPGSYILSVSDPGVEMWAKSLSEFNTKYPGGINCFSVHANLLSRS